MQEKDSIRPVISGSVRPLHDDVLVYDMYFGEQVTNSGIIIMDDDKTDQGIHPRWAKIYAVGPGADPDLTPDLWILIDHGRWSRGFDLEGVGTIRRADPKAILMYSDVDPDSENNAVVGPIPSK